MKTILIIILCTFGILAQNLLDSIIEADPEYAYELITSTFPKVYLEQVQEEEFYLYIRNSEFHGITIFFDRYRADFPNCEKYTWIELNSILFKRFPEGARF